MRTWFWQVIDEPVVALPELTAEQIDKVNKALRPTPAKEVLTEKFKITITRHDLSTLKGLNWLNDEVCTSWYKNSHFGGSLMKIIF